MTYFLVRTPNGYVGRYTLNENQRDDMPAPLAAAYDTRAQAEQVAAQYPDAAVEES